MRILMIEDEARIASFVKSGLESEGFLVERRAGIPRRPCRLPASSARSYSASASAWCAQLKLA